MAGFVMEERLVAVLYAGFLIGAGIGVVMRAGASTGGMDIPALIEEKTQYQCVGHNLPVRLRDPGVADGQLRCLRYPVRNSADPGVRWCWIRSCCLAGRGCR